MHMPKPRAQGWTSKDCGLQRKEGEAKNRGHFAFEEVVQQCGDAWHVITERPQVFLNGLALRKILFSCEVGDLKLVDQQLCRLDGFAAHHFDFQGHGERFAVGL